MRAFALLILAAGFFTAPIRPSPTPLSPLDGTPGNWSACRGNGAAVCVEKIDSAHAQYWDNHPACMKNTSCAGQYFPCNAACPPPTANDLGRETGTTRHAPVPTATPEAAQSPLAMVPRRPTKLPAQCHGDWDCPVEFACDRSQQTMMMSSGVVAEKAATGDSKCHRVCGPALPCKAPNEKCERVSIYSGDTFDTVSMCK